MYAYAPSTTYLYPMSRPAPRGLDLLLWHPREERWVRGRWDSPRNQWVCEDGEVIEPDFWSPIPLDLEEETNA